MFDLPGLAATAIPAVHRRFGIAAWLLLALACFCLAGPAFAQTSQPRTVSFPSADGRTTLTGYLFAPEGRPKIAPAVVLLHGRNGAYSALAKGNFSSVTLNKNIRGWAELWAQQGYWALVVDSFGPRGSPAASPAGNGAMAQPLDAYGAMRYLRASPRVRSDRIAVEGWSDGGSAALAAMSTKILPVSEIATGHGFRGAIAFSPGCGPEARLRDDYVPYAPVRIFVSSRSEAAAVAGCEKLAATGKAAGGDIAVTRFESATLDFDDAGRDRQDGPLDGAASTEARRQAIELFTTLLGH